MCTGDYCILACSCAGGSSRQGALQQDQISASKWQAPALTHGRHQLHIGVGVGQAEPAALHGLDGLGGRRGARVGDIDVQRTAQKLCNESEAQLQGSK